jgi:hypothetical protein
VTGDVESMHTPIPQSMVDANLNVNLMSNGGVVTEVRKPRCQGTDDGSRIESGPRSSIFDVRPVFDLDLDIAYRLHTMIVSVNYTDIRRMRSGDSDTRCKHMGP